MSSLGHLTSTDVDRCRPILDRSRPYKSVEERSDTSTVYTYRGRSSVAVEVDGSDLGEFPTWRQRWLARGNEADKLFGAAELLKHKGGRTPVPEDERERKIVAAYEKRPELASRNALFQAVGGNQTAVLKAIDRLVERGVLPNLFRGQPGKGHE